MSIKYRNKKKWGTIQVQNDDPMAKPFSYPLNDKERLVLKLKKNKRRNGREISRGLIQLYEERETSYISIVGAVSIDGITLKPMLLSVNKRFPIEIQGYF